MKILSGMVQQGMLFILLNIFNSCEEPNERYDEMQTLTFSNAHQPYKNGYRVDINLNCPDTMKGGIYRWEI